MKELLSVEELDTKDTPLDGLLHKLGGAIKHTQVVIAPQPVRGGGDQAHAGCHCTSAGKGGGAGGASLSASSGVGGAAGTPRRRGGHHCR